MFKTTYQLLFFFDYVEELRGRKKLQKMIHLLKSSGVDFPFRYRYHHYGPYSSQLQSEIDQLVYQDFLIEKPDNGAYTYVITAKGKNFKQMLETEGGFTFSLNKCVLDELEKESTPFLEMYSTYVFLRETGDTDEEAFDKAKELKPHLAELLEQVVVKYEKHIIH